MTTNEAMTIRAQLRHPVLDCDGHWVESLPVLLEYLRSLAGAEAVDRVRDLLKQRGALRYARSSPEERSMRRIPHELGVGNSGTRDLATATAWAFDPKRGAPLKTVFGSDLSHPDVPVMTHVLPEAYELVEKGLLSEDDFAEFSFRNGVRLHGRMNPKFFEGTAIEREAAALLSAEHVEAASN